MARPGGPKRGAGPNQYEGKVRCECDRPLPQREFGGVSCLKCGHMLSGVLSESRTAG